MKSANIAAWVASLPSKVVAFADSDVLAIQSLSFSDPHSLEEAVGQLGRIPIVVEGLAGDLQMDSRG